jgi:hypothetical protein
MAINLDAFQAAEFVARTETVQVPQLADFCTEGSPPQIIVRGLTASELQRAMDAGTRQNGIDTVIKAIASQKEQVAQIRQALGISADVPGEIAKRIEMLVLGCVSPKLTHANAVKIGEVCPVEFYEITSKITMLTGKGGSRVKPPPSTHQTPP